MVAGEDWRVAVAQRFLEAIARSGASRQVVAASACAMWPTVCAELDEDARVQDDIGKCKVMPKEFDPPSASLVDAAGLPGGEAASRRANADGGGRRRCRGEVRGLNGTRNGGTVQAEEQVVDASVPLLLEESVREPKPLVVLQERVAHEAVPQVVDVPTAARERLKQE